MNQSKLAQMMAMALQQEAQAPQAMALPPHEMQREAMMGAGPAMAGAPMAPQQMQRMMMQQQAGTMPESEMQRMLALIEQGPVGLGGPAGPPGY